jgi:hypothetical protein
MASTINKQARVDSTAKTKKKRVGIKSPPCWNRDAVKGIEGPVMALISKQIPEKKEMVLESINF